MLRRNSSPLFVIVLLAGLLFGTAPVHAHDTLVSVTPDNGGTVEEAPDQAILTFSGILIDVSPQAILQKDGETIETEPISLDGHDVIVPLPELEAGDYTIVYSVVSSDGHRIDGTTSFNVAVGTSPDAEPDETSTTDEPTEPQAEETTAEPTDDATVDTAETADDSGSATTWIRWGGIIIVVLGVAVIIARIRSRSR